MHFITNYSSYRDLFFTSVTKACKAGVDVIQFSWEGTTKEVLYKAEWVREITKKYGILMCVNNKLDIANIVGADYLHIGQKDIPIEVARAHLSKNIKIGYTITQASQYSNIADYYGVGPIYPTRTKTMDNTPIGTSPLVDILSSTNVPVIVIGGVTLNNYSILLHLGCYDAAVIGEVYRSQDMYECFKSFDKVKQLYVQGSDSNNF